MSCEDCCERLLASCGREGCALKLAEARTATVAPTIFDGVEAQVSRLDVEDGDILVVRTRRKVSEATAAKWQGGLERLVRAAGVKDVSILVLDDCTDITVERFDTRMQHQPPRPTPIVS